MKKDRTNKGIYARIRALRAAGRKRGGGTACQNKDDMEDDHGLQECRS